MTSTVASERADMAGLAGGGAGTQRARQVGGYVPMLPFFGYVTLFLLLPTVLVLLGAFQTADGSFTLGNISAVLSDLATSKPSAGRSSCRW